MKFSPLVYTITSLKPNVKQLFGLVDKSFSSSPLPFCSYLQPVSNFKQAHPLFSIDLGLPCLIICTWHYHIGEHIYHNLSLIFPPIIISIPFCITLITMSVLVIRTLISALPLISGAEIPQIICKNPYLFIKFIWFILIITTGTLSGHDIDRFWRFSHYVFSNELQFGHHLSHLFISFFHFLFAFYWQEMM